jgi:protein virilizer
VQACFPGGGNRLGATNPSQFDIEFFVNDLSLNVASTFEPLGKFSYNQNECINLDCKSGEMRKIPTDGLVLKGCYTTITLAVYGNIITYGSMQKIPGQGNIVDGNAAQISSNDETNESDSGEITNNQWGRHNDFQDQNSSCDPTVSSTIADDLKEDDPMNSSPADMYSRSPNKESNSPEESSYQNNNKRPRFSGSYEPYERRKPRTPPLQSPRISRPDSDDELKKSHLIDSEYNEQSALSTTFCPSSPSMVNNNTPIESPTEDIILEDDPVELEPILSDEDIIDDVNGIEDLTDEMFAEEFPIKTFNPFTDQLKIVSKEPTDVVKFEKFKEQLRKICENYEQHEVPFTSSEMWLSMCEQLIHCLHAAHDHLIEHFEELKESNVVRRTFMSCTKIGLDYSLSIKYHQAGCNLRHLKAGIRLIECIAGSEVSLKWIIEEERFDLFTALFDLFPHQLVPMPIKLMIARVLYKLIDTKIGIEKFIEFDGYKNIINMLSAIIDIRLLYTFKSVIRKIHVYESLQQINALAIEVYRKNKNRELCDYEQIAEIEHLFTTLSEDHKREILQTKKFVPIANQFEVHSKSKAPDYVSYYKIHHFMESLVLLLTSKHLITPKLLLIILNYIKLMMENGKEINYFLNDVKLLNDLGECVSVFIMHKNY